MKSKFILIPALTLFAGTLVALTTVHAVQAEGGHYMPLVERIAEKFGLNKDEVQDVFVQFHEEHHAQMQLRLEEKLTKAVADGLITETQKAAILEKMSQKFTIKLNGELSEADHLQMMHQHRQEFEQWLTDNGLTKEIMHQIGIGPFGKGMHGFKVFRAGD